MGGQINTEKANNLTAFLQPFHAMLRENPAPGIPLIPGSPVLMFKISGPQTQSHQPISPQSFWGLIPECLGHFSIWDSVHAIDQLFCLELCWWDMYACCQNRGAHSHRKQLETGFRQDKVKVIWHRVLPVKCSDLPCLHTVDLIYSLPHPLSFSLHLFSAVILGHSLLLYWSVLIRAPKSCIILKYSSSIPKLCLSFPQ